jgi:hypothetical protein
VVLKVHKAVEEPQAHKVLRAEPVFKVRKVLLERVV